MILYCILDIRSSNHTTTGLEISSTQRNIDNQSYIPKLIKGEKPINKFLLLYMHFLSYINIYLWYTITSDVVFKINIIRKKVLLLKIATLMVLLLLNRYLARAVYEET